MQKIFNILYIFLSPLKNQSLRDQIYFNEQNPQMLETTFQGNQPSGFGDDF